MVNFYEGIGILSYRLYHLEKKISYPEYEINQYISLEFANSYILVGHLKHVLCPLHLLHVYVHIIVHFTRSECFRL